MKIRSRDIKKLLDTLKKQKEKEKSGKKKKDPTKELNINEVLMLQKEAYDTAREMGAGVMESLRQADLVKEEINLAKTGVKKRYTGIMKLLGADPRVADVFGTMFGKKINKEEQEALKKKYGMDEKKDDSTTKATKETAKIKNLTKRTFDLLLQVQSVLNGVRLTILGIASKLKANAAKEVEIRDGKYFDPSGKRLRKKDIEKGSGVTYSREAKRFKDVKTGKFVSGTQAMFRMNIAKPLPAVPALTSKILKGDFKQQQVDIPTLVDNKISDESIEESLAESSEIVEKIVKSLGEDSLLNVHNKLDLLLLKTTSIDIFNRRRTRTPPTRTPGRLGRVLEGAKRFAGSTAGATTLALTGAVAATGTGLLALNKGMAAAGEKAKSDMDALYTKYGLKTIYDDKGNAVGYNVLGTKYGLNDLPQEYKDLIDAYGPGDKRNFAAREALKRIQANEAKYKALELAAISATPMVKAGEAAAPPTPPPATPPPPAAPASVPPAPASVPPAPASVPPAPASVPSTPSTPSPTATPIPSPPAAIPSATQIPNDGITQTGNTVKIGNEVKTGGTVAWRTNNPGNISWSGIAKRFGAIGRWMNPNGDEQQRKIGIAIMPTLEAGYKLMTTLWRRPMYQNLTIGQGAHMWVKGKIKDASGNLLPPDWYGTGLAKAAGASVDTPVNQLSDSQLLNMVKTQSVYEGFKVGRVSTSQTDVGTRVAQATTSPTPAVSASTPAPQTPALAATKPTTPRPPSAPTTTPPASTPTPMLAAATPSSAAPTPTPMLAAATPSPTAPTATPVEPMPATGDRIAAQTTEVTSARETMTAQLSKPVVIAPSGGKSAQAMPPQPAPSAGVKAQPRHTEDAFSRALAKDFAHPSTFTSVRLV